jgi:hypothetical protein
MRAKYGRRTGLRVMRRMDFGCRAPTYSKHTVLLLQKQKLIPKKLEPKLLGRTELVEIPKKIEFSIEK